MNIYVLVVLLCSSNHSVLHSVSHLVLSLSRFLSLSRLPPRLFIFLSSLIFAFFITSPLQLLCLYSSLCLFHFFPRLPLCLCLLLRRPSFFFYSPSALPSLRLFLSPSPAVVVNRSLVGCWSVRNGRSDGFSQLSQAFPVFISPHCPLWSWRSDLQAKYTKHESGGVLNIWTALMCAWFMSPNRPTSEHISCNNKINQPPFFKGYRSTHSSGFAGFKKHILIPNLMCNDIFIHLDHSVIAYIAL